MTDCVHIWVTFTGLGEIVTRMAVNNATSNPTSSAENRYECFDCGARTTADSQLVECPECGGDVRNISVPRE